MFTFRKASTADRFLIRELASQIWENTYKTILSKDQIDYMFDMMYAPENLLKQMTEQHHQFFIVYANLKPAGYLSIEKAGENTFIFQKIYSLPEMHGSGIGRFIIEEGTRYLKTICENSFTIELFVNRYNPAVGFYKHMGFQEIGTRDHAIGHDFYMNDYIMALHILRDA